MACVPGGAWWGVALKAVLLGSVASLAVLSRNSSVMFGAFSGLSFIISISSSLDSTSVSHTHWASFSFTMPCNSAQSSPHFSNASSRTPSYSHLRTSNWFQVTLAFERTFGFEPIFLWLTTFSTASAFALILLCKCFNLCRRDGPVESLLADDHLETEDSKSSSPGMKSVLCWAVVFSFVAGKMPSSVLCFIVALCNLSLYSFM